MAGIPLLWHPVSVSWRVKDVLPTNEVDVEDGADPNGSVAARHAGDGTAQHRCEEAVAGRAWTRLSLGQRQARAGYAAVPSNLGMKAAATSATGRRWRTPHDPSGARARDLRPRATHPAELAGKVVFAAVSEPVSERGGLAMNAAAASRRGCEHADLAPLTPGLLMPREHGWPMPFRQQSVRHLALFCDTTI